MEVSAALIGSLTMETGLRYGGPRWRLFWGSVSVTLQHPALGSPPTSLTGAQQLEGQDLAVKAGRGCHQGAQQDRSGEDVNLYLGMWTSSRTNHMTPTERSLAADRAPLPPSLWHPLMDCTPVRRTNMFVSVFRPLSYPLDASLKLASSIRVLGLRRDGLLLPLFSEASRSVLMGPRGLRVLFYHIKRDHFIC